MMFEIGSLPGANVCFDVVTLEDDVVDGDEVVILEVSSDDAVIGSNISLTITDKEGKF